MGSSGAAPVGSSAAWPSGPPTETMPRHFRPQPPAQPAVVTIVEASRASRGLIGRQLRDAHRRTAQTVLDLGPLASLDSAGVGEIAAALRDVLASGGDLRIGGACPAVRAFLALTRLSRVVNVHATVEEAINAFTSASVGVAERNTVAAVAVRLSA